MEATVKIEVGKDGIGEFMQHSLELNNTRTQIARSYYKIVDEQLIKNMPQDILEDMVTKGKKELESREIDDLFDRGSRYYTVKET